MLKPDFCKSCRGYSWGCGGYVPASGSGTNGVLIVAEAAGADEAAEGTPLVGKAGHYLWSNLARIGIEREGFRCHNVLSCRPPDNKLAKMPYERDVIASCAPLLDSTIADMRKTCLVTGKTFVILTLGKIAFKRVMGIDEKDPIMGIDYLNYPFWKEEYGAWVLAADHPSFLMRGNHHLLPIVQYCFQRALEIASNGLQVERPQYLEDPDPAIFQKWVEDYLGVLDHDPLNTFLSYDIETPWKQGKDEEDIEKDAADDQTILRCSFAYRPNEAISVPWNAQYVPILEDIFASDGIKVGWNNEKYDSDRVKAHMPINGVELDGMLAWHVLNTSMRKGLGYVTPFYAPNIQVWKHLSHDHPAFYNAKDADMALRCWLGIRDGLKQNHLWPVFEKHVVKLNEVLGYMSGQGVLRDEGLRTEAEGKLTAILGDLESKMEAVVPFEARKVDHVFKNRPKETEEVSKPKLYNRPGIRVESACSNCGLARPGKPHFKKFVKKVNPCADAGRVERQIEVVEWFRLRDWKLSKDQLLNYQRVRGHSSIVDRKTGQITFDENAIIKLMKKYPKDELYPLVTEFRGNQKLLGTYIGVTEDGKIHGGMPIGKDGRIHTTFTTDASTLRSTSRQPNLQNLPRPKGKDDLATIIRNLIHAGPGQIFLARDYSGIEAVLVGYFALAPRYIRLSKIDVHSYYTAYALNQLDGRVRSNDLPDVSWSDDRLATRLSEIKAEFKTDRNNLYKHLVHGANFMQGAKGAAEKILNETGKVYSVDLVKKVMGVYFELFPEIKRWHSSVLQQAEKDGFLRNPFGYIHRFNKVYEYEKIGGQWIKEPGPEANKVIAFLPQSTAAGIIKESMLNLWFSHFETAGKFLRLLIHDELFFEVPTEQVDIVDKIVQNVMEAPIKELQLPKSYNMGPYLSILTEAKEGSRWGNMHGR